MGIIVAQWRLLVILPISSNLLGQDGGHTQDTGTSRLARSLQPDRYVIIDRCALFVGDRHALASVAPVQADRKSE